MKGISKANKWRDLELKRIEILKNEMINKKIDAHLIHCFTETNYAQINKDYNNKINKSLKNNNNNNNNINNQIKELEKKRKKAIDILIKNEFNLEKKGLSQEEIQNYMHSEFNKINEYYELKINEIKIN